MENKKTVIALTLGDPYDPKSRSGVNYEIFNRMNKYLNIRAYDCSLKGYKRYISAIKSLQLNYIQWKRNTHQNNYAFKERSVVCQKLIDKFTNEYDAIYQDGAMFMPLKKNKLFVTNHDANVVLTAKGGKHSVGSHYCRNNKLLEKAIIQEKKVYQAADKIYVRSNWVKQSLIHDFKIESKKIEINPSGVHLDGIEDVEKHYYGKNILFVGKDTYVKGYDVLLKAFEKISYYNKNVVLHIVGNNKKNTNTECIKYYGYIDRNKVKILDGLYRNADLFILPSRYDSFPKVLIEAGAYKLPCISTNICGIPEIVEHGRSGYLVEPEDYKKIALYANEILNDTKLSKKMGNQGFKNYKDKFNWDKHVKTISNYIINNC